MSTRLEAMSQPHGLSEAVLGHGRATSLQLLQAPALQVGAPMESPRRNLARYQRPGLEGAGGGRDTGGARNNGKAQVPALKMSALRARETDEIRSFHGTLV